MEISTFFDIRGLLHMNDLFSILKKIIILLHSFFLQYAHL